MRLAIGILLGASPTLLGTGPARAADDFPTFDQSTYCATAVTGHTDAEKAAKISDCKNYEASSKVWLAKIWPSIPVAVKATCSKQMKSLSEGSYFILTVCLASGISGYLKRSALKISDDFPQYEPSKYCGLSVVGVEGPSRGVILESCIANETESKRKLSVVWNDVPPDIKLVCGKQMATFQDGSYFLMSVCVVSEVARRWLDNGGIIN
ncbi:hypothetical protein [Methylobacterium sp. JK268]